MFIDLMSLNLYVFISIILIGAGLMVSFCGFIGNININSNGGNVNISGMNAEMEFVDESTDSIELQGADTLKVSNSTGCTSVVVSDVSSITLSKKLYLPKAVSNDEKQNILTIFKEKALNKNANIINATIPLMSVMGVLSARVDLEITVPENFNFVHDPGVNDIKVDKLNGDVKIQNNVGKINLSNLNGPVNVHTNSGMIMLDNIKNAKNISVNAGNIVAKNISIPDSKSVFSSSVGMVDIDIDEIAATANCELMSNTGNLSLVVSKTTNVLLKARSNMGKVNIDSGLNIVTDRKPFMGADIEAVVNEPGGLLDISSKTGSIDIKLK